jgi:hypothetical protein
MGHRWISYPEVSDEKTAWLPASPAILCHSNTNALFLLSHLLLASSFYPSPTLSPTIAPSLCGEGMKWYVLDNSCQNNEDNIPVGATLYITLQGCCINGLGTANCNYVDVCEPTDTVTLDPTLSPTLSPSFR